MFKGVTVGYRYKMHIVKKHFPIEVKINQGSIEIGRFLGERIVKVVKLLEGVTCSKKQIEPINLTGITLTKSRSLALTLPDPRRH